MAARKKKSEAQKAYEKELRRINRFIKSAEKRGFRFDKSEILPPKPKRYTQAAVRRLKELKAPKLYQKATYMGETGKVVSGYKGRQEERKKASLKGWKKRRSIGHSPLPPDSESIILDNVYDLIDQYPTAGARYLRNLLQYEISKYGRRAVAKALARAPEDMVRLVQEIVFYQGSSDATSAALRHFAEIITGTILNDEELKEIAGIMDEMDEWDEYA